GHRVRQVDGRCGCSLCFHTGWVESRRPIRVRGAALAPRELRALPRDRARRRVERDLEFAWRIVEGMAELSGVEDQAAIFHAPGEPGVSRIEVQVRQGDAVATAEAVVTVTEELLATFGQATVPAQGLPGYSFERAAGESWRSRFDAARNLILVNNGH